MRLSDFDYGLPPERIAQSPAPERDGARLFVHDIEANRSEHRTVSELTRFLRPGDLLVLNDTRVLPCRLFGRRASGGRVELFFVEPRGEDARGPWKVLCNPARKIRPGERIEIEGGVLAARAIERTSAQDGPGREWIFELFDTLAPPDEQATVGELLERHGSMPLPPYIARPGGETQRRSDRERYQTVFARHAGAIAAPTAGLHFTPRLLEELQAQGVGVASVTLHVGLGTFQPIRSERIEEHRMHTESYRLSEETARRVREVRAAGGRVVAVGTTSVRVLESSVRAGRLEAREGTTDLFLTPGSAFHVVDVLLTNFHLPRSTLLLLVSAFAGRERILGLYAEAIERGYRFFSYGDAMLLMRRA